MVVFDCTPKTGPDAPGQHYIYFNLILSSNLNNKDGNEVPKALPKPRECPDGRCVCTCGNVK